MKGMRIFYFFQLEQYCISYQLYRDLYIYVVTEDCLWMISGGLVSCGGINCVLKGIMCDISNQYGVSLLKPIYVAFIDINRHRTTSLKGHWVVLYTVKL